MMLEINAAVPDGGDATTPYHNLTPDTILNAVESTGFQCNGSLLELNSYENRVCQVGVEEGDPLVVKFYRAGRWSDDAILEEHAFAQELADLEIAVVPPLVINQKTLFFYENFRLALYSRRGGRAPDLERKGTLAQLGRILGRIHAVGAVRPFKHRPSLNVENFGTEPSQFLLESGFIPMGMETPYRTLVADLLDRVKICFTLAGHTPALRLHGDCHSGNIMWVDGGPHLVDFDDARMGPAVQDLWMCLSGDYQEKSIQLTELLTGYDQFFHFNNRELNLVEALRTLRMIHYAAWIARRWRDPAFPRAFPWFNGPRYWDEHVLALREQAAMMEELPLARYI